MFWALCAHYQEVKIVLYSICYHHTCRWPSRASVHRTVTYRCDDTRCCIIQFWPPDEEHIVLETCRGIQKTYYKARIFALSWLITKVSEELVAKLQTLIIQRRRNCIETMPPFGLTKRASIPFKIYCFTFALVFKVFVTCPLKTLPWGWPQVWTNQLHTEAHLGSQTAYSFRIHTM
jgi:hypothetical protein